MNESKFADKIRKAFEIDDARLGVASLEFTPAFFGFSCSLAFTWLVSFGTVAIGGAQASIHNPTSFAFWSSLGTSLTMVALVFLARWLTTYGSHPRATAIFGTIGGMGALLLVLYPDLQSFGQPLIMLSALMSGACQGWLAITWGELFCTLNPPRTALHVFAAFLGSLVLYFVIEATPTPISSALVFTLLPLSCTAASWANRRLPIPASSFDKRSKHSFKSLMWRIVVAVFSFWLVYCLVNALSNEVSASNVVDRYRSGLLLALFLILALTALSNILLKSTPITLIYRFILPVTTIGLTFLMTLGLEHSSLGITLLVGTSTCLDMFYYILIFDATRKTHVNPAWAVGLCRSIMPLCTLLVVVLSYIILPALNIPLTYALLFAPALCLIIVGSSLLFKSSAKDDRGQIIDDTTEATGPLKAPEASMLTFAKQFDVAVQMYGLSEREAEVLLYTMRGRSAAYIADKLVIARSTVKTHTTHIYQKMNVSDRQEMLDLIESLPLGNDGSSSE